MSSFFEIPILFLIFNRPDTTELVFDQIKKVKPKYLYIAADGPRGTKLGEAELCRQARGVVEKIDWDCEIRTLFRDENLGCGKAVDGAITWFFDNVESGIILEDDCIPDLSFFGFCSASLSQYSNDSRLGVISGTNYLFNNEVAQGDFYFSRYCSIWGWATWGKVWKEFKQCGHLDNLSMEEMKYLVGDDDLATLYFDHQKAYSSGSVNTWDIPFVLYLLRSSKLSLVSGNNLISNIGYLGAHSSFKTDAHEMPVKSLEIDRLNYSKVVSPSYILDKLTIHNITQRHNRIIDKIKRKLVSLR